MKDKATKIPREGLHYNLAASAYMRDLKRYPPLGEEEFAQLMSRSLSGDRDAFNQVVQANLRFVVGIASEYHNSGMSFEELLAEGNMGLIRAVEKFDPDLGYKFTTYAVWWIRQSIHKALWKQKHLVRLPTNRLDDMDRIRRSAERLSQRLGRQTSMEDMASELQMTPRRVRAALDTQKVPVSLDASLGEDRDDRSFHEYIPATDTLPDEDLMRLQTSEKVQEAIRSLKPRDAEVIALTFGLEGDSMTLSEVGARMGISRERVRQIRNRALQQLRSRLEGLDGNAN